MPETLDSVILETHTTSLVLACAAGERPRFHYWGPRLNRTDTDLLKRMTARQHAPGSADREIESSVLNEFGGGLGGATGFAAHRAGTNWASLFLVDSVLRPDPHSVTLVCRDEATQICARHFISLDPETHLLTLETEIENLGADALSVDWCAAASLPLDQRATQLFGFTGRWAGEFHREQIPQFTGSYVRENKSGRTSHDCFPGLLAGADGTTEQAGLCFAFHFGWSGNHRIRVDRLSDGHAFVQMGEYFFPGEVSLAPGETYKTPTLFAGVSQNGFSALSRQFHRHVTSQAMDDRITRKPRPIHYNTWEAVYFNHDQDTLFKLAEAAAEVGAERFILDDGWFGGRRSDKAGLGDWWVSEEVYPNGLGPLIEHVTGLGLEFGLWFEPEMVNPDSDLYRAHPDWVLHVEGVPTIPFRHQLALDLTRTEVSDYLFERMHNLLSAYDISYIKWDMNRDLHNPGREGRAVASRQTRALYALMDRIREAHASLEIESCSSGGGRADYGVLQRTDRIWTSDSNDALDRQRIQRGASYFFPLATLGAHVGPETCHITGRRLSMQMRVATALFGHMGMELNLLEESEENLQILKAGLALHKQHRALIHQGDFYRLETPEHVNAIALVAEDQSEALLSWCNLTGHLQTLPGRIYMTGLDPSRAYRTRIVWPNPVRSVSRPSVLEALDLGGDGTVIPSDALAQVGLQAPLLHPETCLIYHFEAE
ncbi:MAG: alpha-galactosidase [Pseudomonadota bacterium]